MVPKKRNPAVINELKLSQYKPTVDLIQDLYLSSEFKIGPPETPDEEDFELLSTIRYDPLLSTDIDIAPLIDPNDESAELFFLFDEHWHRINFELMYFKFGFQIARAELLKSLKNSIRGLNPINPYRLRLTVDRYGKVDVKVMNTLPRINLLDGFHSSDDYHSPIWHVYIDSDPTLISPFTSFKTTRRNQYNLARERSLPADSGVTTQEVLLYNTANQLLEGSITNIAIKQIDEDTKEECWSTPSLSSGCLCGVVRHMLLAKGLIKEKLLTLKDVNVGDDILLFNGLQGVVKGRIVG